MLTIRFHPEKRNELGEVEIAPPYEIVAAYLQLDVQHNAAAAREVIAGLERVRSGQETHFVSDGNAYVVEARDGTVHLSCEYDESVSLDVPIAWFIDALERWASFVAG